MGGLRENSAAPSRRTIEWCVVAAILALHLGMLAWCAVVHSPTFTEVKHLPAGLSHLDLGRFDAFRVNPPLVRTWAAIPVRLAGARSDWSRYSLDPLVRAEGDLADDFLRANPEKFQNYFVLARLACLLFSLVGAWGCYSYSRHLYGRRSGIVALVLWCTCPYVVGHGSLISTDVAAASAAVVTHHAWMRWSRARTWRAISVAAVLTGLMLLTKFTLAILIPVWIALTFARQLAGGKLAAHGGTVLQMGWAGLVTIGFVNLGYEFEGTLTPLRDYRFQSQLLTGRSSTTGQGGTNRFSEQWSGQIPIPLPANLVQGIDSQMADFDRGAWSYLAGNWQPRGWISFYVCAFLWKLPLGFLGLGLLALTMGASGPTRQRFSRGEFCAILPGIVLFTFVSLQTGFSIHSRYAIPALPFAIIWCSRTAAPGAPGTVWFSFLRGIALTGTVVSSCASFPHHLSYFNEACGGFRNGGHYLLDSNLAWGQDLLFLKAWHDQHPQARPLHLAHYGLVDPRLFGIPFQLPPTGPAPVQPFSNCPPNDVARFVPVGPRPGWFVLDMNHLHGSPCFADDGRGGRQWVACFDRDLTYFRRFTPAARVGGSLVVYQISLEDCNRVRRMLLLPELPAEAAGER